MLGGVPRGQLRYDNLKAAVVEVINYSRARLESQRWLAFRSHYELDPFYCLPGQRGARKLISASRLAVADARDLQLLAEDIRSGRGRRRS